MSLNERLIGAGAVACTTDTTDVFGDGSGIALYTMDYDASDAGGLYDGTPTNVDFGVEGQINYGARFNGTSAYISTGGSIVNSLTSITVAGWFYTEPNTNYSYALHFGTTGTDGDAISISRWNNTASGGFGAYTLYANIGSGSVDGNYTLNENTWYHIAITWTGTTMKFYVNGNLETTATTSSLSIPASGNSGYIGRYIINQSFNWKGTIDQLRIFNKALSSDEVSTLYAETACVYTCTTDTVDYPTTNVAYYKLDNSAEDETGIYDGTATNINYTFGRFGQAAVFNGSSSYITINSTSTTPFDASSEDFSISAWINVSSFQNDACIISKWGSTSTNQSYFFGFGGSADNTKLIVYEKSGSTTHVINSTSTTITTGSWFHVAYVRNPTQTIIYINGVAETFSNTNTINSGNSQPIIVGRQEGYAGTSFNGKIDQVRIFSSALTSTQVTELYEEYECEDTSTFNPVLYTGNGSTQYISNVGFEPDLVWIKARSVNYDHQLHDIVRGAGNGILSNNTSAEFPYNTVTSFDANGFTVDASTYIGTNANNQTFVAWCWKAGGIAVSNTDGTRTSQVSANVDAGFSILTLDKPNTNTDTYGHGLSEAPELIILKRTASADDWYVYSKELGNTVRISLNSDAAKVTGTGVWGSTTPTNSVFTLQNQTGGAHVAYCFHSVAGYSKIGSYSGSNSPITIYTTDDGTAGGSNPFEPAFIMTKRTNSPGGYWIIQDNKRRTTNGNALFPNSSAVESLNWNTSFNSNGFTISSNEAWISVSGGEYIYMAFA
jgi:hypothetical protein